jgi:hypothetical protein
MKTKVSDREKILDQIAKLKQQLAGKCAICGYDKTCALGDHTDEKTGELITLCCNCHREIHSGN